jgi:hypothetical protein
MKRYDAVRTLLYHSFMSFCCGKQDESIGFRVREYELV